MSLPAIPQWREVELLVNWTVIPFPTPAWAKALRPELSVEEGPRR
ncbi:MAG TPA: hypothetical protein VNS09_13785 [Solirubrobacter sp.]|nr:hypothetical protein [Solirubrobacter sp.]